MLKSWIANLGRLRLIVQLLMLFLTVYGGIFVGSYTADKLSNSLPALSCAYDQMNGGYCTLIRYQHNIHHSIGMVIARTGEVTVAMILPLLVLLASFFAFFFVLGKAFCGWVCPLGTLQEFVGRIGRRFGIGVRRVEPGDLGPVSRVRPVKWLILVGMVFLLPLLAGLGVVSHSLGNPFCDTCPSRIATTLLTGNADQLALNLGDGWSFGLGAVANWLIGFMIVGGLALRLPFCRICPLLAFNSLFQRLSLARLSKPSRTNCGNCRICTDACPMDIPEISQAEGKKAYNEDCTLCGRCAEFCPQDGVVSIKWANITVFRSSREYYKARIREELPDGTVKLPAKGKNDA
ncbi:4Fe-4S binding protein [Azonexus sp.]|jgi:ferredoxin|uniref:4Fe-4S binding protein n=1 Tax=Azonexus sp. TaxID=1872668 RepID=UPI002834E944|nr:4Fe-4S binding protein [Azonexus sp.]MDR1995613.1 4Fe-4S binding protein [Azonexus sp.]